MLSNKAINKIFEIGILIKSSFGIFEVLAGILIVISGKLMVDNIIIEFAQQEISKDPDDMVAYYLKAVAHTFSAGNHLFAAAYLISHGAINIFLAIALLKNKRWAYPWAIAAFSIFIVYQLYRYFHTHSLLLLLLTFFDMVVVLLVWLEYRKKATLWHNGKIIQ